MIVNDGLSVDRIKLRRDDSGMGRKGAGKRSRGTTPARTVAERAMCVRLAQARAGTGLSQLEAAKLIGAGASQYQKWELRSPPPAYYLPKICEVFRIDCWWLLTGRFVQDHLTPSGTPAHARPFREAS